MAQCAAPCAWRVRLSKGEATQHDDCVQRRRGGRRFESGRPVPRAPTRRRRTTSHRVIPDTAALGIQCPGAVCPARCRPGGAPERGVTRDRVLAAADTPAVPLAGRPLRRRHVSARGIRDHSNVLQGGIAEPGRSGLRSPDRRGGGRARIPGDPALPVVDSASPDHDLRLRAGRQRCEHRRVRPQVPVLPDRGPGCRAPATSARGRPRGCLHGGGGQSAHFRAGLQCQRW